MTDSEKQEKPESETRETQVLHRSSFSSGKTTNDIAQLARQALQMSGPAHAPDPAKSRFTADMRLFLEAIEEAERVEVAVQAGDMVIGRSDDAASYTPEIDLAPLSAYRLGVSRRHALLRHEEDALWLFDLGSRNGTLVNGVAIGRETPCRLHHGDEIAMANLRVRVVFEG